MDQHDRTVSEIMRCEVATLAPDEKLDLADDIMRLGRVRHMPVVENSTLVGVVSTRDLLAASLSKALEFDWSERRTFLKSVNVNEAMTPEPVTVAPETTLRSAAKLMLERKIGCLPVVKPDGTLLGLLTETDMLAAAFLPGAFLITSSTLSLLISLALNALLTAIVCQPIQYLTLATLFRLDTRTTRQH